MSQLTTWMYWMSRLSHVWSFSILMAQTFSSHVLKAMFYCRQFLDCAFSQFQCQRLVKSLESFQHFVTDSDEYKTLVILELWLATSFYANCVYLLALALIFFSHFSVLGRFIAAGSVWFSYLTWKQVGKLWPPLPELCSQGFNNVFGPKIHDWL